MCFLLSFSLLNCIVYLDFNSNYYVILSVKLSFICVMPDSLRLPLFIDSFLSNLKFMWVSLPGSNTILYCPCVRLETFFSLKMNNIVSYLLPSTLHMLIIF